MKKRYSIAVIFIVMIIFSGCKEPAKDGGFGEIPEVRQDLSSSDIIQNETKNDELISNLLLEELNKSYLTGECGAEGHIILGQEIKGEKNCIYVLSMVGNYGFENNIFTKISGSGVIPTVVTIDENNNVKIEYPLDGAGYTESIEKMFPKEYQEIIWNSLDNNSENYKEIKTKEIAYAKSYLEKIGRTSPIEDHVEKVLLTDKGVLVEVSNGIIETFAKQYPRYPYFIGNQEAIEDGVRMVYEMNYDQDNLVIEFIKYKYDTKEEIEKFLFNSETGEQIKLLESKDYIYGND